MTRKILSALLAAMLLLSALPVLAEPAAALDTAFTANVSEIQKYGNLVLDAKASDFFNAGFAYGDIVEVTVNGQTCQMPVGSNYSDVDQGSLICRAVYVEGGDDYIILAINMGDLATTAGIATKEKIEADPGYVWHMNEGVTEPVAVSITMAQQGGYYDEWVMHQLQRTNNREDYPELTDAEYANFRTVATTGMGEGRLYRSSNPVNPELNRNKEADAAAKEAGVKTFINLADNEEVMRGYEGFADSYYSTQNIIALNLGVDFSADDFKAGLAKGIQFIAGNEGPYLVHCTEGKDRAGFVSAILECLMGATADDIVKDYMITYYNYYAVKPDGDRYQAIANSNIKKSLATAFGIADISDADLVACAEQFLLNIGVSAGDIAKVKENLK